MAGKDPLDNEEYILGDVDAAGADPLTPPPSRNFDAQKPLEQPVPDYRQILVRGGSILGGLLFVIMMYSWLSGPSEEKAVEKTPTIARPAAFKPVTSTPKTVSRPEAPVVETMSSKIEQRLSQVETTEQALESSVASVNNQLTGVSNTVTELTNKIDALNQALTVLSTKLDEQSHTIEQMMVRTRPARPSQQASSHKKRPTMNLQYYIQAIIPGRAWLISTQGSTITVRDGTSIPNYGRVTLIDAHQGRVLTSSGRMIRFNQDDS